MIIKNILSIIILSYIIGSIPTAYILTKIFKGIDIRTVGSKNPGTTNVIRTAGFLLGILTFIVDFMKGVLPAILAKKYLTKDILPLTMFFTVLGHTTSPFLSFKGGKGVATFFGSLFVISISIFIYTSISFLFVFFLTHIVSISSIISVIVFLGYMLLKSFYEFQNTKIFFILTVLWIIYRHKTNIKKLILKEEKKLF
jgi:glycerol-3-phosphate acyltransferase PlsY